MTKTRILIVMCSLVLGASACKKKEEAKPATSEAKPGEAKPADKPTEAAKPAGEGFANAGEYEAKAMEMSDKMTAMFGADGKDCDKLAGDMSKFIDENKTMFASAKAFEAAHPEAKKALDTKMEPKMKEMMEKMGPAMEACKDHQGLKDAMTKLAD
jgi:hypothetical protein